MSSCFLSFLTFFVINNSWKLKQLVFIDSFPHQMFILLSYAFCVISVKYYGHKEINLKKRGNECINILLNESESGFPTVLCLPFVFHCVSFISLVFTYLSDVSFYFFFFLLCVTCSRKNGMIIWLTCIAFLHCNAEPGQPFILCLSFLPSIACRQYSFVWFDNCFQKYI